MHPYGPIPTSYSSISTLHDTKRFLNDDKTIIEDTFTIVNENGTPKTIQKISDIQFDIYGYSEIGSENGKSILNVKYKKSKNEDSHLLIVSSTKDKKAIMGSLYDAIKSNDISMIDYLFNEDKRSNADMVINEIYNVTKHSTKAEQIEGQDSSIYVEPQHLNDFVHTYKKDNENAIYPVIFSYYGENRIRTGWGQFDSIVMLKDKDGSYHAQRMVLNEGNLKYIVTGISNNGVEYRIPESTRKKLNFDANFNQGFIKTNMQITQVDENGLHVLGNFDVFYNIKDKALLSNYYQEIYKYNHREQWEKEKIDIEKENIREAKQKEDMEADMHKKETEHYKDKDEEALKFVSHYVNNTGD